MAKKDQIKRDLDELVKEAVLILQAFATDNKKSISLEYQSWYTKALRVVEVLAPDRYGEFRRYYEPDPKRKTLGYGDYVIQDYLKGVAPNKFHFPNFDIREQVGRGMTNQVSILRSLEARIDYVLADIQGELAAEMQESEIETARKLVKVSTRAAGALAGVLLEAHLQRIADNHKIGISKKSPTINDLNDPLKQAGVYDIASWRKISYLADVRNLCLHKKPADPSVEQVNDLINGVEWAIKNIF